MIMVAFAVIVDVHIVLADCWLYGKSVTSRLEVMQSWGFRVGNSDAWVPRSKAISSANGEDSA